MSRAGAAMACLVAVLSALLGHAGETAAQAGDKAPVAVKVDPCVPIDAATFNRLLRLELGTSAEAVDSAPAGVTEVQIACSNDGIDLDLRDPLTRKRMHRTLRPERLRGEGAERLLALAVAEFVVASWIELSVQPEPSVEPVGAPPPQEIVQAAQETVAREQRPSRSAQEAGEELPDVRLGASLGYLGIVGTKGPAWLGGRLLLDVRLMDALYLEFHAEARFGEHNDTLGAVKSSLLGGRAVLSYALAPSRTLRAKVGLGFQLARLHYQGVAPAETNYTGVSGDERLGGPFVSARLGIRTGAGTDVGVRLDLGIVALPVELYTKQTGDVLSASGTFFCIAVDVMAGL